MHSRYFNLFSPQTFSEEEEQIATRNNIVIDFYFGHKDVLEEFASNNPTYRPHLQWLKHLTLEELEVEAEKARRKSVLMTVIMLTGECNADCPICYTDRRKKRNELTALEIKRIMDETYALGSRLLYVPGEGEPTLDKNLFEILEHASDIGMQVIMFTNGLLLSSDDGARSRWGITSEEFVHRLSKYPVYLYHKLWSTNPQLVAEMMHIDRSAYQYVDINVRGSKTLVPRGLDLLLRYFPRERIGVEVVVERRNVHEVTERIIPLAQQLGIKSYIEPIIHAGRCFNVFDYDALAEDMMPLGQWLARQNCRRVAYKVVVHSDGTLSYGMALPRRTLRELHGNCDALQIRYVSEGLSDLFTLIHANPVLVWGRYQIRGCICEEMNLKLAASPDVRAGPSLAAVIV
ncbi:MAG: hypothetical protein DME97_07515 [Verrucomicrobia bacterium]|nr:MAG: hypothetical protein DME97_07515 [Verrucomicrobiota bacterium]